MNNDSTGSTSPKHATETAAVNGLFDDAPKVHKKRRPYLKIVLVVVFLWALVSAFLIGCGIAEASDARKAMNAFKKNSVTQSTDEEAEKSLARASKSLSRSHSHLSNPVLAPIRIVPYVGRQLRSATAITGAGATVTSAAIDAVNASHSVGEKMSTDRVGALKYVSQISNDALNKVSKVDLGPDAALIGPLARARNEASTQLSEARDSLQRSAASTEALSQMMERNQTYLLIIGNNNEMRSGSGMFLTTALVKANGSHLELSDVQTLKSDDRSEDKVAWPQDLDARWGWIGKKGDYRNLMMSPRFDAAAPLANEIWKKRGGQDVQGIVVVDPVFFRGLLKVTGPVQVDGKSITSENVLTHLMVDQYRGIDLTKSTVEAQENRREGLSGIAAGAFAALDSGHWDAAVMAREMNNAANGRHILVWSPDVATDQLWQKAQLSGRLSNDSLMVSSINVGANKMDQFLKIENVLSDHLGDSGQEVSLKITMKNEMPDGLPGYVTGPTPGLGLSRGEYSGLLSISAPNDARDLRFDGKLPVTALGQDGPSQIIATRVRLLPGQSLTYTVRYRRSPNARFTIVEPSGRWPASAWQKGDERWFDDARRLVQH